jgi:hypothetical protein
MEILVGSSREFLLPNVLRSPPRKFTNGPAKKMEA